MKNKDLFKFVDNFDKLSTLKGIKYTIAITKNYRKFKSEVELFRDSIKNDKYIEYLKYKEEIQIKHSNKDENDKPIIINNTYKIVDLIEFNKDIDSLKLEYKDTIDDQLKSELELNKILEEDIEFKIYKLDEDDLPDNITPLQLDLIYDIINWK